MSEQPAPAPAAAPAAADKQTILRGFAGRINAGEFDPQGKDFHQFVVKEIYPLLGNGTLSLDDFERLTHIYSAKENPYNKDEG